MGGDLNYVCDPTVDRFATTISSESYSKSGAALKMRTVRWGLSSRPCQSKLLDLFNKYGLIDAWRALYTSAHQYTYFSSSHNAYSKIDFILMSKVLFNSVLSADIGLHSLSDHAPVYCLLARPVPTAKGWTWWLNTSLLPRFSSWGRDWKEF